MGFATKMGKYCIKDIFGNIKAVFFITLHQKQTKQNVIHTLRSKNNIKKT